MKNYVVELSTPADDVIYIELDDKDTAEAIFHSITVTDWRIPRVSVCHVENHVMTEIMRKETEAWKKSVEIAKEEEVNA